MIRIRQAHESDLAWLLTQLREFNQFYGTLHSLFGEKTAFEFVQNLVQTQLVLIAEKEFLQEGFSREPERAGFIAGSLGPHPYNSDLIVLSEQFWWVMPQYRGGSAGARLFAEFIDFGREHAKWIVMTLESKSPVDPSSLERHGFREFERSYLLEIA